MPTLYEYLGITIHFYSNEHDPIHVHGYVNDMEIKAKFILKEGKIDEIILRAVGSAPPLSGRHLKHFTEFVEIYANEIVKK